jgi:hypothetical protein
MDAFLEDAVSLHAAWVSSLARISRDDLEAILKLTVLPEDVAGIVWQGGRPSLVPKKSEEAEQADELEFREQMRRLASDALNVLRGEHADPDRIENVDRSSWTVAKATAGLLTSFGDEPRFLAKALLDRFYVSLLALPIGQADCPFWLLTESRSVAVLVRTREKDNKTHKPVYELVRLSPGAESFGELERAVRELGTGRMRVTRLADLYANRPAAVGQNILAYQFGTWLHTERAGSLTGIAMSDETHQLVWGRIDPNPMIANQQWLTGRGFPAAARTKRWVETNTWTVDIGGESHDISAWAHHVAGLARRVLEDDGREDQGLVVDRVFGALYGNRLRVGTVLDAFEALRAKASYFEKLLELLKSTGLGGGTSEPASSNAVVVGLEKRGVHLFETRDGVRDVVAGDRVLRSKP